MTISEKLVLIADNTPKVYDAGYEQGKTDGEQSALDAVNIELSGRGLEEAESVDEISITLDDAFITLESNGFESGKKAEYDRFWDAYQNYGKRDHYVCAFSYYWNDTTYNPKYPIYGYTYGLQETFRNSGEIIDTKVPLYLQNGSMRATFHYCAGLKRIPLLILEVPVTDLANAFSNCISLEEINIVCVSEGCIAANISLNASCNLSGDSVQSVIDALKDLTGETALTLTLHKDVGAKLTEAQKAEITAKNWILVY